MPLEEGDTFFFQPRPLKNLVLVDEQENLSPIMFCQVCKCLWLQFYSSSKDFIARNSLFLTDCWFGQWRYSTVICRLWPRTPVYSKGSSTRTGGTFILMDTLLAENWWICHVSSLSKSGRLCKLLDLLDTGFQNSLNVVGVFLFFLITSFHL